MTTVNPYYYGLVKQIGPWKTTREDILRGQKPYQYTPNEETENPYTMKSANSQLYEQYSSQGLIYDAATSPVITAQSPRSSKLKRGKVVRAKKEVKIVDPSGNIVSPTDNYFLNRYMGEMRGDVQESIIESDLGGGQNDLAEMASARASTATMASASTASNSAISEEAMSAIPDDGPAFEDLNIFGEENIDRGAQVNDPVVNDQIDFVQNLERERMLQAENRRESFKTTMLGARLANTMEKSTIDPNLDKGDFKKFYPTNLKNVKKFLQNKRDREFEFMGSKGIKKPKIT